ncbi:interleukin-2 receptor subunit beta isoform X1 [Pogona vitticeps]
MIQPAVMKTSLPLLFYILAHSVASGLSQGNSNLACLYDSVQTLSCVWTPAANTTDAPCNLTASVPFRDSPELCQLYGTGNRSCLLKFERAAMTITDSVSLDVICHIGEKMKTVEKQKMKPFKNLQLKPPCDLQIKNTSEESYNLTWKFCDISHYLKGKVEYEVRYKIHNSGEADKILPIIQDQKWLKFENLSPGTAYEAAVRAKVRKNDDIYNSTWSNWSTLMIWKTEPEAPTPTIFLILAASSTFIVILAIALSAKSPVLKRLKNMLKIHLPNPDEFFPSLNAVHGGDVQKWLSSPTSMSPLHVATAASDVSLLEIMLKDHQEPSLHFPKACFANMDTPEMSEQSSSSCFINGGYFSFQHQDSFYFEPCKVYFTYDLISQGNIGCEDGDFCSYRLLHEKTDTSRPSPPTDSITAIQENNCFVRETKEPTERAACGSRILLCRESFSTSPKEKQDGNQGNLKPILLPSWPPLEGSIYSTDQSDGNNNRTGAIQNADPPVTSAENHRSAFLQSAIQNQGQANVACRAVSSSQLPSASEGYLSMRDLQSHYTHYSI